MVDDQRFAPRRPDVLVYQTEPLEEDVTLAGPVTASLSVSTTGTDSDWVVKAGRRVPDDYPIQEGEWTRRTPWEEPPAARDGRVPAARAGEPFRGSSGRASRSRSPSWPGQVDTVEFTMRTPSTRSPGAPDHGTGAEQLVPAREPEPQAFVKINEATAADFRKATSACGGRGPASLVRLTVLP